MTLSEWNSTPEIIEGVRPTASFHSRPLTRDTPFERDIKQNRLAGRGAR